MSIHNQDSDSRFSQTEPIFVALGPLQVRVGGGVLHVGGPRIRTSLALLLARPGQVVSMSTLVSSLWPHVAPPSAERTVRTYMSRLRHALTPASGRTDSNQLVIAMAPGYLLRVDPMTVDARRFEQLALAGRRALIRNDLVSAQTCLDDALAMWHGEAYAEFNDVPMLRAEASRLEELRLNTVENQMQCQLRLGFGSDLVAEMEGLVAAYPLRERLWVQYMIALYQSGRQAEALSAYQRARAYLTDELGLEPCGELADIHGRILAHDPSLLPLMPQPTFLTGGHRPSTLASRTAPATELGRTTEVCDPSLSAAWDGSPVQDISVAGLESDARADLRYPLPETVGPPNDAAASDQIEGDETRYGNPWPPAAYSAGLVSRSAEAVGEGLEGWLMRLRPSARMLVARITRRSTPLPRWSLGRK